MRKVKATVLKCAFHEDLVRNYAKPGLGPCRYNREGMEFICETPRDPRDILGDVAPGAIGRRTSRTLILMDCYMARIISRLSNFHLDWIVYEP